LAKQMGSRFTDPSALIGGFKRTAAEDDRFKELKQEEFLKNSVSAGPTEMPEDLLKFLNDIGPVKRSLDKEMSSPKLVESLQGQEEKRSEREKLATQRQRRRMPMIEGIEKSLDGTKEIEMEAVTTSRTTNFSNAVLTDGDQLLLRDKDLFQVVREYSKAETENWRDADLKSFVTSCAPKLIDSTRTNDAGKLEKFSSDLTTSLRFIGIPVLLRDEDNSLVGIWQDRLSDMQYSRLTKTNRDKLLLEVEDYDQ